MAGGFRCLRYALVLLLCPVFPTHGQESQVELRNIFERAQQITNLKAEGMPGFRLAGTVRIWTTKDLTSEGKYLSTWNPDGKWKEEITFADYKRVRIGDGRQFWQARTAEFENFFVFDIEQLLNIGHVLRIREGETLKRSHSQNVEGVNCDCIQEKKSSWTYCFDANSSRLFKYVVNDGASNIPWRIHRLEYSQYQQWAGKTFPRLLRGFSGKQPVMEVQLDEIVALPTLPPNFFSPSTDATAWSDCIDGTDGQAWKLANKVQPLYPESARMRGLQGTVVLYALIGEDGHLSKLLLAHSAGRELDQAAFNAVSKWRYERTDQCKDSKGGSETLVDVIFTLQR